MGQRGDSGRVLAALEALAGSRDGDASWEHLERLRHISGFDYCGIGVASSHDGLASIEMDRATDRFSDAVDEYTDRGLDKRDPSAKAIASGAPIMFTNEVLAHAPGPERRDAQLVFDFVQRKGFYSHAAMAVDLPMTHGSGFLAFGVYDDYSTEAFRHYVADRLPVLRLGALAYVNTALHRLKARRSSLLSAAEHQVLTLVAQGLTLEEVAEATAKSVSTVRRQCETARRRLGARNTVNAVSIAAQLGILDS